MHKARRRGRRGGVRLLGVGGAEAAADTETSDGRFAGGRAGVATASTPSSIAAAETPTSQLAPPSPSARRWDRLSRARWRLCAMRARCSWVTSADPSSACRWYCLSKARWRFRAMRARCSWVSDIEQATIVAVDKVQTAEDDADGAIAATVATPFSMQARFLSSACR